MTLYCPYLSQFPEITHGFFEEDPEPLPTRWPSLREALGWPLMPLLVLKQVHGNQVFHVTGPREQRQEGDGLVTATRGVALGVETADCGPILFYEPQAQVIGACHAGWRGARGGIIQKTLVAMEGLGAQRSRIQGTLGPTIQQADYEVGPEFPDLIGDLSYFRPSSNAGHHYFDLPRYIRDILTQEGVGAVNDLAQNTFDSRFASRRRALGTHTSYYGGLSVISLL